MLKDANDEIEKHLAMKSTVPWKGAKKQVVPEIKEYPLNDIDIRHNTYTALLEKLTLASDHKANMLKRGLTEEIIIAKQYKTTPLIGG